jgi:hypothetical protein
MAPTAAPSRPNAKPLAVGGHQTLPWWPTTATRSRPRGHVACSTTGIRRVMPGDLHCRLPGGLTGCGGRTPWAPNPALRASASASAASPYGRTVILPKDRETPVHHHPPRADAHRLRPSAPGSVGGRVRGARSAPLRVGAALRPPASSGHRADSGMGSRRDQDVSLPRGGRPCHSCGMSVERGGSSRSIRCRPGRGGGACRCTRAWVLRPTRSRLRVRRPSPARLSAGRLECRWQCERASGCDSRTRPG